MESIWEGREYCGYCWRTARLHQSPKKPILHPGNAKTGHRETRSPAVIWGSYEKSPLLSPAFLLPLLMGQWGSIVTQSCRHGIHSGSLSRGEHASARHPVLRVMLLQGSKNCLCAAKCRIIYGAIEMMNYNSPAVQRWKSSVNSSSPSPRADAVLLPLTHFLCLSGHVQNKQAAEVHLFFTP